MAKSVSIGGGYHKGFHPLMCPDGVTMGLRKVLGIEPSPHANAIVFGTVFCRADFAPTQGASMRLASDLSRRISVGIRLVFHVSS